MSVKRHGLKNAVVILSCVSGFIAFHDAAFAQDTFTGPRIELRGTYSELLANDYNAGYCYAYVGSNNCISYPSKKLSSETSVGGEIGYDAPLSTNTTIGVYGRYDFGSGSNQDGNLQYTSKNNYAIGAKVGFGRKSANIYVKAGYQNWTIDTLVPDVGFNDNNQPIIGAPFTYKSHIGGLDIATGVDVRVTGKVYIGGEIGGGVMSGDHSVSGLGTGLKTLRLALKIGTHF